jgi:hypothetical protein
MKKHKKLIIILIVSILILAIGIFVVIKNRKSANELELNRNMPQFSNENMDENFGKMQDGGFDGGDLEDMSFEEEDDDTTTTTKQKEMSKKDINKTKTLKTTAEIKSALTENVELHALYYLEEVYVEEGDFVKQGDNILKYTNGTYLVAPYDCYIINLNLPDIEGKATNKHYVKISSSNELMVTMSIDETNIEKVTVGLEVTIEVTSLGKTYQGNVTHVASTGSNGKFEIEIEFENDGDVKLGMTGNVTLTI